MPRWWTVPTPGRDVPGVAERAPDAFGAGVEAVGAEAAASGAAGRAAAGGGGATPVAASAAPAALVDGLHSLENATGLDPAVALLDVVAAAIVRPGAVEGVLTGAWQGHAAHPFLTDIPIGFWTSASVLDLIGGRAARPAADRLLALGLVAALPTAATGLAEFRRTGPREQRVGVVHAAGNSAGLALYTASYVARRRGRRARGVLLALAGMGAATAAGYLGGHLAAARKVGTHDPAFGPEDHGPEVTGPTFGAEEAGAGPEEAVPDTGPRSAPT